ncbi:MAG TPA: 7TM-DISM domain-containing protein, partial [Xanthomarina sp.]|nr:7TM-DISM domain-containing protein [Xanthomarina sp.]
MADSIASKFELVNSKEVQAHINDKGSSFEDVRESNSWSPYSSELSVNSKQALWLKFDLKNNSKDTIRNYIYSDTPSNTIYQVFKNDVKVFKNGRLIPLPNRTNKSDYYFTEIALDPFQTSQVFIKLHNPLNKKIDPPTLNSKLSYWETLHNINAKQDASISFIYIYIITITTIFVFALVFWLRLWKK